MGKFAAFRDGSAIRVSAEASPTREEMTAIFERFAGAVPSTAALVVAALADASQTLRSCAWLEGELRIELAGEADGVTVHLYTEQGGLRERVLAPVTVTITLDELDVALQAAQGLFAPLRMRHHKGKIVFTQTGVAVTLPPPEIEVASESLASGLDENPHLKATVKQPVYVLPTPQRSGTHLKSDVDDDS